MRYTQLLQSNKTMQTKPLKGSGQKMNYAGGFGYNVDRWELLDRFLITGSESGTYYVKPEKLTKQNAKNILQLLKSDGQRVVSQIVEISEAGRAPKNDAAIFALALAAAHGDEKTRSYALRSLTRVCRTGTHLFQFAAEVDELRGWGRGLRKAVANWYVNKSPEALAYQMIKYKAREGWSNRDLLRLAHPVAQSKEQNALFHWAVSGDWQGDSPLISSALELKSVNDVDIAAELIRTNRIPREAIPTEMLTESKIWEALLADMPLTAMIRNLGNLSKNGVLKSGLLSGDSSSVALVVEALSNKERLRKARIHPVTLLSALRTYESGRGLKGDGAWKPVKSVVNALETAFYDSFEYVESSGKRVLFGLDVSGSMAWSNVAGLSSLSCREAAGVMALASAKTEGRSEFVAFDTSGYELKINAEARLDKVVDLLARTGGGGTDCAIPILHALNKRLEFDAFVIYTDGETWAGNEHVVQALHRYRRAMGIEAKLIMVSMVATRTSIVDPNDARTLNVVGFDASVPKIITEFLR